MNRSGMKKTVLAFLTVMAGCQGLLADDSICYRVEMAGDVASGKFAPTWLTANRYGMGSEEAKSGYLRAGATWSHDLKHGWRIGAGVDVAGGLNMASKVWVCSRLMPTLHGGC